MRHLGPLGAGVDPERDRPGRELSLVDAELAEVDDAPGLLVLVEELLAIGRDEERLDLLGEGLFPSRVLRSNFTSRGLARELIARLTRDHPRAPDIIERPLLPRGEVREVPRGNWQRQNAVLDAVEVDHRRRGGLGHRLFILLVLVFLFFFRRLPLIVIGLLQRVRGRLRKHGDKDGVGGLHVGVRLVEPLLDRAGVGRGEEVQVLAIRVEDRLARFRQAVGKAMTFARLDGVEPDRLEVGLVGEGVREPPRVGRPRVRHGVDRPVDRLGGDHPGFARAEVEDEEGSRVVDEGDRLSVGRPDGSFVEPRPIEPVRLRFPAPVVGADHKCVLARGVGEVGDRLSVGRPDRRALVRGGGPGDVARIPLLGGDGHDLAADFEDRALAAGRDVGVPQKLRTLDISRSRLDEIGRDADLEPLGIPSSGVEHEEVPALFIDDLPRTGGGRLDGEVVVHGELPHLLR